jgi:putative zinc finger/helix-turn-helix YgiT family protein
MVNLLINQVNLPEKRRETMKCPKCGQSEMKVKILKKYHYLESGLSNVYLKGAKQYTCPNCGVTYTGIPNLLKVQAEISRQLAYKKGRLLPSEIKFLRKHMRINIEILAELIGIKSSTIRACENGITKMGKGYELLLRLMILNEDVISNLTSFRANVKKTTARTIII